MIERGNFGEALGIMGFTESGNVYTCEGGRADICVYGKDFGGRADDHRVRDSRQGIRQRPHSRRETQSGRKPTTSAKDTETFSIWRGNHVHSCCWIRASSRTRGSSSHFTGAYSSIHRQERCTPLIVCFLWVSNGIMITKNPLCGRTCIFHWPLLDDYLMEIRGFEPLTS